MHTPRLLFMVMPIHVIDLFAKKDTNSMLLLLMLGKRRLRGDIIALFPDRGGKWQRSKSHD